MLLCYQVWQTRSLLSFQRNLEGAGKVHVARRVRHTSPTHPVPSDAAPDMYAPVELETAAPPRKPAPASRRRLTQLRRALAALGLAALALTAGLLLFRFVRSDDFDLVVRWLQTHEPLGAALYVGGFTSCVVLCFPSTAFELLAGYVFGFWLGLLLATSGKLLGSVLSYAIGRYLCRRRVHAYMARGHPALQGFQSLLRKRQVLLVFLTRVAFFPIAVKNYGLSVLDVRFPVFFAAALLTGLPFSVIWVYSGHAVENLAALLASPAASRHSTEMVLLLVGAGSALLLLFVVGVYTRKYVLGLAEEEKEAATAAEPTPTAADAPKRTDEATALASAV
ncbi:unnamed protein product [Phytophthora lilii]|uniref:Unnamed protein product n=1 Tax=Phytophthora lilii TaxID=2077276 RepID=A0A9W6XGH9_9STRA|nr:unnamed protein product [Phytophthora lilii]